MAAEVYYETCWAILSTIGIFCAFTTVWMMAVFGWNKMLAVPLVVSCACAVANGLCYYAYYAPYPEDGRRVAAAAADAAWLVQEAGLSFYSYQILSSILLGRKRQVYQAVFFSFCALAVMARTGILAFRQQTLAGRDVQHIVNYLHMAYFLSIAWMECANAWFLIHKLSLESRVIKSSAVRRSLLASSEIRMASLCVVGIMRAATYYFQSDAQAATNVASELDRFVLTMESLFPALMLVSV
ncbi:MAG: hypothetical protein BJ554DRAFT_7739 [Olpidium bornovanus]|uniref:Uncharacterized protein n=1 Tax=Olpidium bornovanus TaxID=278681 RepID=A0A8H7ZW09_9FUNG|nr:MAG: hypothetical protein BJ554DRAFT_7739 [Olpidium bornovanus]